MCLPLIKPVSALFGLKICLSPISQKVLTQQLELDGLIHREVYPEIPPKVEYSLTAFGETLKPIILEMHQLGIEKNTRL
ncbi:MAG: hypothetical protein EWV83_19525 [Microcystis sp. M_OC_Ca_00000000_S217Cul]|uniref:Winged helix-turn-helix transcriptional regulator n=1 Tax=Microcystis aeruginosa BLCC-F108 TaxID=2755317 RepID=A0A841UGT9_MICAE|nr:MULTISPECIES: winged helix-turn-helix transcriptional regulator [Microcystis]MBC1190193.1 winged helix-turn-helix transcriptional regulator [Microcystis aeruginosa BLCC-F108]MCA2589554.1 winged helix-turn-helix transcriptional regulator [Microcystis sp. M31BS1]TRT82551.1 MAG: hypothetical protein EWV66_24710 [Microcystis sp. M_OC_Ca_00000000_C217Col]MDB9408500.1 winged helix-turn-helix transcriptional regulator [Microcystis aeruginosa CS-558/01A06]TRT72520.1 MAG: hypothetical protein EWV83_